jgi:Ca-activated chloride channel family protein
MKLLKYIAIIFLTLPVFAYQIYSPQDYSYQKAGDNLLFILDFSNSMGEYLEHKTKASLVKDVMTRTLPQISGETKMGVRVYGHTCNVFAYNACRSSELLVPFGKANANLIINSLSKLRPRGMTPITYSLKQAVKKDFATVQGSKHIILLTDGGENCDESPCNYVIDLVKTNRDIQIDVIAFDVKDSDDLAQLKCTADVTGGKFIETKTSAQLMNSMQDMMLPHKQVEALLYGSN